MVSDVIDPCGNAGAHGLFLRDRQNAFDNVIDERKVAPHVSMIKNSNRLVRENRLNKQEGRHVGASPWAIDGKEAKAGGGDVIEMAVTMRHEFSGLLGGRIE